MQEEPIVILDMEAKLKADADGAVTKTLVDSFEQDARQVRSEMDRGMAPEDFSAAEKVKAAFECSATVLKAFHRVTHAS